MDSSKISIVGHTQQRAALFEDLKQENVAHAYLFSGPPHVGKMTVAKWFAAELLQMGVEGDKERARAAEEVQKLIHPDLLVLDRLWMEDVMDDWGTLSKYSNVPQNHRAKAKAKTDTISIDDVRAIQERLYETGTGRYRCCIIRSMERMQDEAVNALLKIVEEPPQGVVFLLTTQASASLLPTLISRARTLAFQRLPAAELETMLTAVAEEDAAFIRMIARGAPGTAKRLMENPDALAAEKTHYTHAVSFWRSKGLGERLRLLKPLEKRGDEAERLLFHLSLALKQDIRTAPAGNAQELTALIRALESNASKPLLLQKFALGVAKYS